MDKVKTVKKQIYLKKKTKRTIFYCLMVALPILQFCVFYIGVNLNSILLSFKTISKELRPDGSLYYKETFTGLSTFKLVFENLFAEHMKSVWKNTFLSFFLSILFSTPLGLLFSYYIFKKFFGSGVFKVLLFLPQIVSQVVFALFVPQTHLELLDYKAIVSMRGRFTDTENSVGC